MIEKWNSNADIIRSLMQALEPHNGTGAYDRLLGEAEGVLLAEEALGAAQSLNPPIPPDLDANSLKKGMEEAYLQLMRLRLVTARMLEQREMEMPPEDHTLENTDFGHRQAVALNDIRRIMTEEKALGLYIFFSTQTEDVGLYSPPGLSKEDANCILKGIATIYMTMTE